MLTLQEVLDLQAQNKITITIDRSYTNNSRYTIVRASNDEGQYYLNEYCLFVPCLHTKNYSAIRDNFNTNYCGSNTLENILVIDKKLYIVEYHNWTSEEEQEVKLAPFDGYEYTELLKIDTVRATSEQSVKQAVHKLVLGSDSYPFGTYRRYPRLRKYRKSEIQAHPTLPQDIKDELCEKHSKYFVLFSMDGDYIGLYPRPKQDAYYDYDYDLNDEATLHINYTLDSLFGQVFTIRKSKYEENIIITGVSLC